MGGDTRLEALQTLDFDSHSGWFSLILSLVSTVSWCQLRAGTTPSTCSLGALWRTPFLQQDLPSPRFPLSPTVR